MSLLSEFLSLTPNLNVDGSVQRINFNNKGLLNNNLGDFGVYNAFTPLLNVPANTYLSFINSKLSGFKFYHSTSNTQTIGNFSLQLFNGLLPPVDIFNYNEQTDILTFVKEISLNLKKLTNIQDGVANTDAVTLGQLKNAIDGVAVGINFKNPCSIATTSNLDATYLDATPDTEATLTNNGTLAVLSIDGVTPVVGDRVLVKNQVTASQNGIYVVTGIGSDLEAWILTRSSDYNSPAEITQGNMVAVQFGDKNAGTTWLQTASVNTMGVDAVIFTQFSYGASTFLQTGNNLSDLVDAETARSNLGLSTAITSLTGENITVGGTATAPILSLPADVKDINSVTVTSYIRTSTLYGNLGGAIGVSSPLSMNNNPITSLPTPINDDDAATKSFAESLITPQLQNLSNLATTGIVVRDAENSFVTIDSVQSPYIIGEYKFIVDITGNNNNIPAGFLLCDGSSVSMVTYAALYDIIGFFFGSNAPGTFKLPDLRGKVLAAVDTTNPFGTFAGVNSRVLTTDQLPTHTHSGSTSSTSAYSGSGGTNYFKTGSRSDNALYYTGTPGSSAHPLGYHLDNAETFSAIYVNSTHSHSVSINNTGNSSPVDMRQPTCYGGNYYIYAG